MVSGLKPWSWERVYATVIFALVCILGSTASYPYRLATSSTLGTEDSPHVHMMMMAHGGAGCACHMYFI